MPERIDARPGLALIGGALVLVSLFLDWYQAPGTDWAMNAWAAFESLDLILAGAALATLYVAWEQVSGRFRIGDAWLLPLGLLVLVIVVSQILDPPPAAIVPAALPNPIAGPEADPATGVWLALGGAGALVLSGVLSMAKVGLALTFESPRREGTTTRRRPAQGAS